MLGATKGCELLLEGRNFRPHQKLAMIQDTRGCIIDRTTEPPTLRRYVNEGDRTLVDTGVLIHWSR